MLCDRRQRGFGPAGQAGYQPLDGCPDGMTAEQMRALPIVIAEKRSRRAASGEDGGSTHVMHADLDLSCSLYVAAIYRGAFPAVVSNLLADATIQKWGATSM